MRRYAPYAVVLTALLLAALLILLFDSTGRRVPGGPKATATVAAAATTDVPSAWSLLTAADLKTLTGGDYQARESPAELAFLKSCAYDGPQSVALTIVVGNGAPLRYESIQQFPDHVSQAGLGDDAIWVPSRGILAVRNDEETFQIEVGEFVPNQVGVVDAFDNRLEIARAIADHVLNRITESTL